MRLRLLVVAALAALTVAPTTAPAAERVAGAERAKLPPRKGGEVRRAWPRLRAGRPRGTVARWLARQVGPVESKRRGKVAAAAAAPLQVVRSHAIPADDPSYERLLNRSWTYDGAVTAAGFVSIGSEAQAERLLDQFAALQRTDGSLEYAYDALTGAGTPLFRSGAIAWVGLAGVAYREEFDSSRYDAMLHGLARWLLARQVKDPSRAGNGMLAGGPEVSWVSTQHNLVAYAFLSRLAGETKDKSLSREYATAAAAIAAGLDRRLVASPDGTSHFEQGADDSVQPLDVQTLGILYLVARGRKGDAARVRLFVDRNFAVAGRSIALSDAPATYNLTWAAAGPFRGYRPYAGAGTPDVLWTEGTIQARVALDALGVRDPALDASIASLGLVTLTRGLGPLGADRTVTGNPHNEYHVWPNAAAAAWTLLALGDPDFLFGG